MFPLLEMSNVSEPVDEDSGSAADRSEIALLVGEGRGLVKTLRTGGDSCAAVVFPDVKEEPLKLNLWEKLLRLFCAESLFGAID